MNGRINKKKQINIRIKRILRPSLLRSGQASRAFARPPARPSSYGGAAAIARLVSKNFCGLRGHRPQRVGRGWGGLRAARLQGRCRQSVAAVITGNVHEHYRADTHAFTHKHWDSRRAPLCGRPARQRRGDGLAIFTKTS